MNSRFTAKLIRAGVVPPICAAPDEPLKLLGEGMDAILVRMDPRGVMPDCPHTRGHLRLIRYLRARQVFVSSERVIRLLDLRRSLGQVFQRAWRDGVRTNLAIVRPLDLSRHRPAQAAPQRQAAR